MERKMTYMTVMGELVPLENRLQKRASGQKVLMHKLFCYMICCPQYGRRGSILALNCLVKLCPMPSFLYTSTYMTSDHDTSVRMGKFVVLFACKHDLCNSWVQLIVERSHLA